MTTLGDVLERNERLYPNELAISFEDRTLTHADFARRGRQLANALYRRGMRHQDRVAILARNCVEFLDLFAAGYFAGFVTVTVNHRLAAPEIEYIVNDCCPSVLLFDEELTPTIGALRSRLQTVRSYICIGTAPQWAERYDEVLAASSPDAPPLRAHAHDIAYLLYTSGTTGRPKGVMLDHRGQVASAQNYCLEGGIGPDDRPLITMPLYHGGGRWTQIAHSWRACPLFVQRAFEPHAVLEAIQCDRITSMFVPPAMLQRVLDLPDFTAFDLSSLRTIYYSSAPMAVPLLRRAIDTLGLIFIQHYGLTEAGGIGTILHKHQHVLEGPERLTRRLASAGLPKTSAEIRIVREDGRTDADVGELGEILIRSPAVMIGYWANDPATRETIVDGWLHTGDIGRYDEDGFIYVVDRKKDMIISGGVNIYSREVEVALLEHRDVADVAVVGKPDREWGEAVHAFVVLRPNAATTAEELITHCKDIIASFKKPKTVEIVGDLPRLPTGKVNKVALREAFWTGRDRRVS
jgi:acyl-CoA synthetase (AMP-forming)/AMP-acid ligase II